MAASPPGEPPPPPFPGEPDADDQEPEHPDVGRSRRARRKPNFLDMGTSKADRLWRSSAYAMSVAAGARRLLPVIALAAVASAAQEVSPLGMDQRHHQKTTTPSGLPSGLLANPLHTPACGGGADDPIPPASSPRIPIPRILLLLNLAYNACAMVHLICNPAILLLLLYHSLIFTLNFPG